MCRYLRVSSSRRGYTSGTSESNLGRAKILATGALPALAWTLRAAGLAPELKQSNIPIGQGPGCLIHVDILTSVRLASAYLTSLKLTVTLDSLKPSYTNAVKG